MWQDLMYEKKLHFCVVRYCVRQGKPLRDEEKMLQDVVWDVKNRIRWKREFRKSICNPKGVGSNGNKNFGLGGKVWTSFSVNNFLDSRLCGEARILPNPCGNGALYRSEIYPTRVSTRSDPALEGFLIKKKKKKLQFRGIGLDILHW